MTVSFQISDKLEQQLRLDLADLDAAAKEAFLVSLYRQGKLSHYELAQGLGLDRFETEDVLHKHNVTEDLGTAEDALAEVRAVEKLRAAGR
jgi:predicted HTH domain antitoxin